MNAFEALGLPSAALASCADFGYDRPTPVQEQAIPLVLAGRDIIAAAKTGTGKTAAFSLPAMGTLPHAKKGHGPLMLVVTPTRELAQQIGETCQVIARHTRHRVLTVVGGVSYNPQVQALTRGTDVLIATPGRLIDLMDRAAVRLDDVAVLVLDEADRMLDMGFWPSMRKIIAATPDTRQTMLFSATIDRTIMGTAGKLLRDPAMVEIAHKGETADRVAQYVIHVQQAVKPALLKGLLAERGSQRVIVFCRTRGRTDATCRRLKRAGVSAEAIHSDRSQSQRKRALDNFAAGRTDVIVATDVLARGIDVDNVNYVVNYDLPMQAEDYIHRIGRTGRAGAEGFAVSFVSPETASLLKDIEKLLKTSIPEMHLEQFDMQHAANDAAAKASRAEARRDPEIQQAKKELAARRRKKEKTRAAHSSNGAAHSKQKPSAKASKAKQRQATKLDNRQDKPAKSNRTAQPGASAKQKQAAKRNGATQPKRTSNPSKTAKPARKAQAPQRAPKQDFRPGRAHRAAVARKRGNAR